MCGCGNGNKDPETQANPGYSTFEELGITTAGFSPWVLVLLVLAGISVIFNWFQRS